MQHADDALQSWTPETYRVLLTKEREAVIVRIQQGDQGRGWVLPPAERDPKQVLELRRETGIGGGPVAGEVALGRGPRRTGHTVRDTAACASLVLPRAQPEAVRWRRGQRAHRHSSGDRGTAVCHFVVSLLFIYLFCPPRRLHEKAFK